MKGLLILFLLAFFLPGCEYRQKEEALQKKEAALNQKEQELLLKEKMLQLKESDLLTREQRLDSTLQSDTTHYINNALIGSWSVKMTCTETTCSGSAVGDVKTEQWDISYQQNNLIARAMDNGKLARVYTGFYTGNTVELVNDTQSTPDQPATKMVVRLRLINETTMEGQREISRGTECKVIYSLQLDKKS